MGLLDDLQMGFGLKERDDDYYERTAATIGRQQGAGAEERYRGSNVFQEKPAFGGPFSFFGRGGEGGGITGPRDFFDGGGLGRSGDTFVGGPVSILANLLGIRPMGYNDRDRVGQRAGMGAFGSGVLRPTQSVTGALTSGYNLGGSGQPETRFDTRTEAEPIDYSDTIPVQDPATIAATEALANLSDMPPALSFLKDPSDTMPEINNLDLFRPKESGVDEFGRRLPLNLPSDPTYYSGVDFTFPELSVPVDPVSNTPVSSPSLSDADQMMALRSAIMRQPNMVGEFEQAFGADMVREALSSLRSMGGSLIPPKSPLSRREQRSLLQTMPITRFD